MEIKNNFFWFNVLFEDFDFGMVWRRSRQTDFDMVYVDFF